MAQNNWGPGHPQYPGYAQPGTSSPSFSQPGFVQPGAPAPGYPQAPAPGPHQQQPPPFVQPGQGAPVAPPMPGAAPQYPPYGAPMGPSYGAPQPGYGAPQGGFGAPPGNAFAQPGAPQGGFRQSGRRFSGADMAGVKMSGTRNPFLPLGMHVLEILKTNQSQRKGSFVAEVRIVWTNSAETQVGAVHSWIQSCADLDIALPKIKRFTVSALGFDKEEQAAAAGHDLEQIYTAITSDEQQLSPKYPANPLKGAYVNCSVQPPNNRPDGSPGKIPRHDFSPVQRQG